MDREGDRDGRKILPLGQGALDLELLRIIRDSGYRGPIGILGHTQDDAEERLRDNLDGLDWLVPQLDGQAAGPAAEAAHARAAAAGSSRQGSAGCRPARSPTRRTRAGSPRPMIPRWSPACSRTHARQATPRAAPSSSPRRSSPASRATRSAGRGASSAPTCRPPGSA